MCMCGPQLYVWRSLTEKKTGFRLCTCGPLIKSGTPELQPLQHYEAQDSLVCRSLAWYFYLPRALSYGGTTCARMVCTQNQAISPVAEVSSPNLLIWNFPFGVRGTLAWSRMQFS